MSRNPRYDILFEPVRIGPVTAPNRFYATPHALGAGNQMPHTRAAMREVRAEGGWGVVNTGYCSIHPSSDDAPLPYGRLWDDEDLAAAEAGSLKVLMKLRDEGVCRFAGVTSHTYPDTLAKALERHDFDCTQMALNAAMQGRSTEGVNRDGYEGEYANASQIVGVSLGWEY